MIDRKSKRYIRFGDCNLCGDCCLTEGKNGGPCEYLEELEDGRRICSVFNDPKKRFERCYIYPQAPPLVHKRCSYAFIDTWEGDRVVKFGKDL